MLYRLKHPQSVQKERDQIGASHVALDEHFARTQPQKKCRDRGSDHFGYRSGELCDARESYRKSGVTVARVGEARNFDRLSAKRLDETDPAHGLLYDACHLALLDSFSPVSSAQLSEQRRQRSSEDRNDDESHQRHLP